VLVGVSHAAVIFFFVFVLRRVRSGITAHPELLNKIVTLGIVAELQESTAFFIRDNERNRRVFEPLLVLLEFLLMGITFLAERGRLMDLAVWRGWRSTGTLGQQ